MKQDRTELQTTTSKEKIANSLLGFGTTMSVTGIGLLTSGSVTENPKLFTAGGITFIVGLAILGARRLLNNLSTLKTCNHFK